MKRSFIKGILNSSQVFSALIAVLTSAIVTLFFNGFHWLIVLSLLFVVVAICLIIPVLDISTFYKSVEFDLRWKNRQRDKNVDEGDPIDRAKRLHEDTLRNVMIGMRKWEDGKDRNQQVADFEKEIKRKILYIALAVLGAVVCSIWVVVKINQETEKARVETFNNALDKNWIQTQNKMDSLMKSITDFESEMNAGLDSLEVRIKGIKGK